MTASGPQVTVAIPTRNRANIVGRALESALSQTLRNIRVYVLDDESTDDTPQVVASFDDDRLSYVRHEPRLGMAANWNRVFQIAESNLVAILHDDDYWHTRFLERAADVFATNPEMGFVYAAHVPVDNAGTVLRCPRLSLPSRDMVLPPDEAVGRIVRHTEVGWPTILMRRSAVVEAGGFNESFPYHKDWQLWIRLAARYPVGFIAEVLGFYTSHPGQFSAEFVGKPLAKARERHAMLGATIPTLPLPQERRDELLAMAMRSLAETQLVTAWDLAAAGLKAEARREAAYAFEIDRALAFKSPHLVAAAYVANILPPRVVGLLNRARKTARPVFRRH